LSIYYIVQINQQIKSQRQNTMSNKQTKKKKSEIKIAIYKQHFAKSSARCFNFQTLDEQYSTNHSLST